MISVGDAVLKITGNSAELNKALKDVDAKIKASTDSWQKSFKMAGVAMVGVGTAIIGALSLSVKAAAEEEQALLRLGNTLKNVGINYDLVKEPLDKTIMAMEKATAVSHDELYPALNMLLNVTGDYEASLRLLPLALDLAKGANIDLATAAKLVGKVEEGNFALLVRYGIIIEEGATQTEVLAKITERFGGSAEAMGKSASSGFGQIKLSMDALMETIGKVLLPALKVFGETISGIIDSVRKWAEANPELTTGLTIFAAILGVLLLGFGTYILMAPGILAAGAMMGAGFTAMLGPIGLVILAIAAVIAIGVALAKNWDKIVDFFTGSHREMTKVAKEELDKQLKDQRAANQKLNSQYVAANTKTKEDLKKHYGVLEGYTRQENKTLMDLARDASKARGKAIDAELDALGRAHTKKMRMIDEEYAARIDAFDAITNAAIGALESQLAGMDVEEKYAARDAEDRDDEERRRNIKTAQEWVDFNADMIEKQRRRDREDKREAINLQIENIREQAANQKEALQKEHEAKVAQETELYNAVKDRLDIEKSSLDEALQAELVRLELERQAFEKAEDVKLAKLQRSIAAQEAILVAFHDRELARISAGAGEERYATPGGTIIPRGNVPEYDPWGNITGYKPLSMAGFEGIIPGIPGTPIPAIVHAGEYIGQGGGGITNNFNISQFIVREEADINRVARELYRMQRTTGRQMGVV